MFTLDYRPCYTWPARVPYRLKMWDGSSKLPMTYCSTLDDAWSLIRAQRVADVAYIKELVLHSAEVPVQIMPGVILDRDFVSMKTVLRVDTDQIDLAYLLSWLNMHHRSAIHDA